MLNSVIPNVVVSIVVIEMAFSEETVVSRRKQISLGALGAIIFHMRPN